MKNDILYANGCSFAYGIGISQRESVIIQNRFSNVLADRLNLKEQNNAIPGSCNQRILRRAMIDIPKLKPKIAIIIWSDPARFEFIDDMNIRLRHDEDAEQVRPLSIYSYETTKKNAFLNYYQYISSSRRDVMYTMQAMLSVKIMCDSLGIPCIQLPFKNSFNREFKKISNNNRNISFQETFLDYCEVLADPKIFGVHQDVSFDSICGCDKNPDLLSKIKGQEGHPSEEGHLILANWLEEFIDREIIL